MINNIVAQLLDREKYLPLVIGFLVAIAHFVSSYLLNPLSCEFSLEYYVAFVLSVPGFVLRFLIDSLPSTPFVAFGSLFYGMMAALLVSKSRKTQWIGILLLSLLILSSCNLMLMAATICA